MASIHYVSIVWSHNGVRYHVIGSHNSVKVYEIAVGSKTLREQVEFIELPDTEEPFKIGSYLLSRLPPIG